MLKKLFVIPLLGLGVITALFFFGRSLWHPVYVKLNGAKTVNEVVHSIQANQPQAFDAEQWQSLRILGFKSERLLEVWGVREDGHSEMLSTFPFTGYSGKLGPKLREGDRQIPEGIYRIEYLNPNSSYHLSMKLDYPNAFDRAKGAADGRTRLGYDIFIHGKSVTIGCIPIGDAAIEQLFCMVAEIGVGNAEVIIAPYDMRVAKKRLEIESIDWEDELYALIDHALNKNAQAHTALER